jgi:hypothetical protein
MRARTCEETLAMSESVAMIPTVHPAAAGTHEYRVVGGDFSGLGGFATVIRREDIR